MEFRHFSEFQYLYFTNMSTTSPQKNKQIVFAKWALPQSNLYKSMSVYGRLPERLAKVQKCFLPASGKAQISQCFITRMTQTNSDSEPIPNVPRNWWNSVPNRFRRNFYIPFRTVPKFESQFRRPLFLINLDNLCHVHSQLYFFLKSKTVTTRGRC